MVKDEVGVVAEDYNRNESYCTTVEKLQVI